MNKVAFITMDVESYYDTIILQDRRIEVDNQYNCAKEVKKFLDYLNEENIKATFFLNMDFLKECFDTIMEAKETGHDIALHSLVHYDLSKVKDEDLSYMLDESKKLLRTHLKIDAKGYRFPCFHYRDEQMDIVKDADFKYDSSAFSFNDKTFKKINDVVYEKDGFYEFSPQKGRLFLFNINVSGSSVLRTYPWGLVKKSLKRILEQKDAFLFYVHPFELSEDDLPVYKEYLGPIRRLYLTRNRKIFFSRLKEIVEMIKEAGYTFNSMSQFIDNYERRN